MRVRRTTNPATRIAGNATPERVHITYSWALAKYNGCSKHKEIGRVNPE